MDPVLEIVLLATAGLTIAALLRRVRGLNAQFEQVEPAPAPVAEVARKPEPPQPALGVDLDTDMWAMLVSPLSVILSQCELARGMRRMDARLEVIEKQAMRMRDLLERDPTAERQIRSEVQDVDAESSVRAAVGSYAGLALDRDVGMHLMVEPTPLTRTNERLLNRALRHLIRTAITSAPAGRGDVTVAIGLLPAHGEPTHVGFAVADDGPGIEPARLVRILDPSIDEEVEPSAEELAYSVVHALARAMGAQFVMDSAPGTGTRATLKVPLAPVASASRRTPRRAPAAAAH